MLLRLSYLLVAVCAFVLGNAVLFGVHDSLMLSLGNPWAELICLALFYVILALGKFLLDVLPPFLCSLCVGLLGEDVVEAVVRSHEEAMEELP